MVARTLVVWVLSELLMTVVTATNGIDCTPVCSTLDVANSPLKYSIYYTGEYILCEYLWSLCSSGTHICAYSPTGSFLYAGSDNSCGGSPSLECPQGASLQCSLPPGVSCDVECPALDGNDKPIEGTASYPDSGPPGGYIDCSYSTWDDDGSHSCQYYLTTGNIYWPAGYYACPNEAQVTCTTNAVDALAARSTA